MFTYFLKYHEISNIFALYYLTDLLNLMALPAAPGLVQRLTEYRIRADFLSG